MIFLNAALEFGEIGRGRKKLKTLAKDDETKNLNHLEGEEVASLKLVESDPILKS